jgi:hypothetical protein
MSRRVLLPFFALLAIAVLVPCFVGGGTRSGNAALRAPRQAMTTPPDVSVGGFGAGDERETWKKNGKMAKKGGPISQS